MARRSGRLSGAGSKHKRTTSGASATAADPNAKRSKTQPATPTKSPYFEDAEDEGQASESPSMADDGSDFAEPEASESALSEPPRSADDDSDDADTRKMNLVKARPGREVIIKKPKARPAGKTPYTDDRIHPNTLAFLAELKANNKRDWLKFHDAQFRQAEKDWHSFVETITGKLVELDDTIPELPVKDVIFRVYRDIRFSKDPTPYKPWFSVAWSRTGRKGPYAHYYLQVAPNNSFVGGGKWHPEAPAVNALRAAIDRNPRGLKNVLTDPGIRKHFLKDAGKTEAAAVREFVKSNADSALKTRPKGYDAEHPDIDLLRLRNFTVGRKLADEEVVGEAGAKRIAELLAALKPFVSLPPRRCRITYLNSVVMPDDEDEDADAAANDEEEAEGEGEESDGGEDSE
ncbi:Hypothetical predicted protein [Lecanosticta acicola]|uniref:DUF2461 domain-containing protein n=1 Tax=Lecanosticta acicola TaxID=111012 RepID=A0AAI8Z301_9PEZI|nr:Hypothetical predicted protein [Lecanosticta acicola]